MYTIYMQAAWVLQGLGFLILGVAIFYILEHPENYSKHPEASFTSDNVTPMNDFIIRSPAFAHEETIPAKYTCDGENISPPIAIDNVPENTTSLVLIVEDPDVPTNLREDGMWNHWVVFNIPPNTTRIGEGETPEGTAGITTSNTYTYTGPCPPDREHRYYFKLFALDTFLRLEKGATKEAVLDAMRGHILSSTELMGTYNRNEG